MLKFSILYPRQLNYSLKCVHIQLKTFNFSLSRKMRTVNVFNFVRLPGYRVMKYSHVILFVLSISIFFSSSIVFTHQMTRNKFRNFSIEIKMMLLFGVYAKREMRFEKWNFVFKEANIEDLDVIFFSLNYLTKIFIWVQKM